MGASATEGGRARLRSRRGAWMSYQAVGAAFCLEALSLAGTRQWGPTGTENCRGGPSRWRAGSPRTWLSLAGQRGHDGLGVASRTRFPGRPGKRGRILWKPSQKRIIAPAQASSLCGCAHRNFDTRLDFLCGHRGDDQHRVGVAVNRPRAFKAPGGGRGMGGKAGSGVRSKR